MFFLYIVPYIFFSTAGIVLFKIGSKVPYAISAKNGVFSMQFGFMSISGLISYIIGFLFYMKLISKYNLSYIGPICIGMTYLLVFMSALFIFNEKVTIINISGSILVFIGVLLIGIK